jgi:hypothetical protein
MYCPKCSQEQISDEMRFCSRCGFSLIAVRDLVASGNALVNLEAERPQLSCGQKGVRRAAWLQLASVALAFFVGFLTAMEEDFAVFFVFPFLIFLIGFALMLYGVFLADKRAARKKAAALQQQLLTSMHAQLSAPQHTPELYPSRMVPNEGFAARRPQTAEMFRPPSVTENTTRLLEDDPDQRRG